MTLPIIFGIDPGKSGGIAMLAANRKPAAVPMPATDLDLLCLIEPPDLASDEVIAFIEHVHAGPKMGSSAAFKFGCNVGAIRMACLAAGLRVEYVSPQKWQRALGLLSKGRGLGQGDTAKKNRNKAKAQELFPGVKVTHAIADALLLAEYGRRTLLA